MRDPPTQGLMVMRVAAIVEIPITSGGGFNQSVSAVHQLRRLCGDRHELVVFTSVPQDSSYLERLGIQARQLPGGWRDFWVFHAQVSPLLRKLQRRLSVVSAFEREMLRHDVDLVCCVGHSVKPVLLERIPYIATVWDLCHLDHPEFPEVGHASGFFDRELSFSYTLPRAIAVVCASESQSRKISMHYGVDPAKLVVTPFDSSPFLVDTKAAGSGDVLGKYDLDGGYYFYPAQFWPHKNHIRILRAMAVARRHGIQRQAVFTGTDQGNMARIRDEIAHLGLSDSVRMLGFVAPEDMRGLYENAFAVVMPSYFGPTNIPPLEAWSFGIPLVSSRDMEEQVVNAALLVDPDSATDMEEAFLKLEDSEVREDLVRSGRDRLRVLQRERQVAEDLLGTHLESFSRRLECWKAPASQSRMA